MASYTSQPNPAYFEVPIFQAPTEFLFSIARQKQLLFDRGLQQVSGEYHSMENLPVSSQFGIAKRDAYMSQAKEKLNSIAGADFSLAENRSAASSIYKPMVNDQDILYDLSQSRYANQQIQMMDKLQNSTDEKERAQYWDTGRAYVNKSIMDLRNAKTSDELHRTSVRSYVPYTDIIGKLNKAANDLNLNVAYDSIKNGYILTEKNGKRAELPFYIFAQSQLGTQEREVLKVMGSVEADNRVRNTMGQFGIDEQSAKVMLAGEAIDDRLNDYQDMLSSNQLSINSGKAKRDKLIKDNGGQITDDIEMAARARDANAEPWVRAT